jgi:hypothetical protein
MPQTELITPRKKRPQLKDESDGSDNEDESPTKKLKTPKRKVKQEDSDESRKGNAPRPVKKETRTPRIEPKVTNDVDENASPTPSPSKTAQKKAEAAQRKQWKLNWTNYLIENQWKKDPNYTQQAGDDIHKTEGTLKYVRLKSQHVLNIPSQKVLRPQRPRNRPLAVH